MFVGRAKELQLLNVELSKKSSAILIYGKRKIGKTTLINESSKKQTSKPFIYYECIKDTEEQNVQEILKLLKKLGLFSDYVALQNMTFIDLFSYIDSLGKEVIFAIDEYPYLKEYMPSNLVDSIFQNIIDNHLNNINLILCGSHIGMMKDLLTEKNALFGRFDKIIELKELSYLEASEFYPSKSNYEKVGLYSVFGGSPFINKQINPSLSLKENVINLLFDKNSSVYNYASSLLISDFANQANANRIFAALGNGRKSYSELEEILDRNKSGLLSKQIKPLLEMELIKKDGPINKINDSKKAKYEINDNLLRFYYTYILPNQYLLAYKDSELIYSEEIEPTIVEFISFRFEEICRDFVWNYINKNKISNVVNVGTYYYDDPIRKRNGEFDLAILNKNGSIQIIEAKYFKNPVNQTIVNKEIYQIKEINELNVEKIGFISINGFENDITGLDYKFDGNDLFN